MSSVNDLLSAIANRDFAQDEINEDIAFVNERFDKFRKYFNSVYEHVYGASTSMTLVHAGMISVETYQNKVMQLDSSRTKAHDMAIAACDQINRQCDVYGLDHLCPEVETDMRDNSKCANRDEIADFVGKYMYSVFQQGREGRSMEQIMIDDSMKHINRTALDISYETARDAGRNPEQAYEPEDMDQSAYEEFEYGTETEQDVNDDFEYDDDDFGEL